MNKKLADLIGKARKLESALAAGVEGAARSLTGSSARHPLEIVHAVVDVVEQEVQPAGRGQRAFPFNHIRVLLAAASPRARAHLEVACEGPPSLQQRIVDRLEGAGCAVPPLWVKVSFVTKARPDWSQPEFHVECTRGAAPHAAAPQAARLELTVTHGTTGRSSYEFTTSPVTLGRGDEVRDSRQRLIRTNHVAFAEGIGEINLSVSRQHARIEHDAPSGAFRLYDDGSAQGTSVIRKGRGLAVHRGTKGMRLQSGDEIVLGQARVRVTIHEPS